MVHDGCKSTSRYPYALTGSTDLSRSVIRKRAIAVLRVADALHVVPTPVDDIRVALELTSAKELDALAVMPRDFRRKVARLGRKLRGALDTRERIIWVDPTLRDSQARFVTGHEIGHDALPWQRAVHVLDSEENLSPATHDLFEREANYFSSELLFNIDELNYRAAGAPLSLATPIGLHQQFDASLIATTRRFVETHPAACALLVLGRYTTNSLGRPGSAILYGIESEKFAHRFGPVMRGLRLPPSWPSDLNPLAMACFDAVTGAGRPLEGGRFVTTTGDDFMFEVYAARPFPLVLLTPRTLLRRAPRATVKWTTGLDEGQTQGDAATTVAV